MLEDLLPPSAVVVSTRTDCEVALWPEEERVVAGAVEKRRREFVTGRACAREALARLGADQGPLLPGPKGEPRWPRRIVGSITHCDGYRACAVAREDDLAGIGIDAEPNCPLSPTLLADIAVPAERHWIWSMADSRPGCSWDRLLFCTKEAIYKAWFPLTGVRLGFEDAEVIIDAESRSFSARLLVPTPPEVGLDLRRVEGRWLLRDDLLLTAATVDLADPATPE